MKNSKLETVLAGLLWVTIGTVAATAQVGAQSNSKVKCEETKALDALCSAPLKESVETKICFSKEHARCFEIKSGHLNQTLKGATVSDVILTNVETSNMKTSVSAYTTWLDQQLSKLPKSVSPCRDVVTYETGKERKEFCLSKLPAKDVDAKTSNVILTLSHPTSVTSAK